MTNHAPGGGMTERMFPLQEGYSKNARPGPLRIPWSVAEKAYGKYAGLYGRQQTLERLAERGGFSLTEMDDLYPAWRSEVDEITALRSQLSAALQRAEDAEGVMGKALQALDDLCVLHHRDVCGDEAFREASKRVTEKGGTLAVWADTAEMLRAALAAAGEGGGTKA
jgi:hypothetical protein